MQYTVVNNTEQSRFEIEEMGHTGFVEYELYDGGIKFLHTEVPEELGGKGIGTALAKYVLDYARDNKLKIIVYCTFIQAYIRRHPEYAELFAERK